MTVISLTGKVFEDKTRFQKCAEALKSQKPLRVVTGGGNLKRYQEMCDTDCSSNDSIGIYATRLHAKALKEQLGIQTPIPESFNQLKHHSSNQKIVTGGLTPGMSTDAVAAILAELTGSKLVIATTEKGIHTRNPDNNPDAPIVEKIRTSRLREKLKADQTPGNYDLIDKMCLNLIERSNISTKVTQADETNLQNLENCQGTKIITN